MVETPKQTGINGKNLFFGWGKQTQKQPKQIKFRFFRVKSEIFLVCFERIRSAVMQQHKLSDKIAWDS